MKILFDTNILIRLTDVRTQLPNEYADVVRMIQELHYTIVYHPAQIEDWAHDAQDDRRLVNLSRVRQYSMLDDPPAPQCSELSAWEWRQTNANDVVDNKLLYAVKRMAVGVLVTEDRKMHQKARRAGIQEQVYDIAALYEFLSGQLQAGQLIQPTSAVIKNVPLYNLDLNNRFFDSLRDSYKEFNDWFKRIAQERNAWVVQSESNDIFGLCIYKIERDEDLTDAGLRMSGAVLKLCTFKVAGVGYKLGESLLRQAFLFAVYNNLSAVYVQVRKGQQERLCRLLEEFGFDDVGSYRNDVVWMKPMRPSPSARFSIESWRNRDFAIRYYPYHFAGGGVSKYIVPIHPAYHDQMFPEINTCSLLFTPDNGCLFASEANAIKKAYICQSGIKRIKAGDLLLFYRCNDVKAIDTLGVVEQVVKTADTERVFASVARRTVLTDKAISSMVNKREVLVLLFRFVQHLRRKVTKRELADAGIAGEYQSIRRMPESVYRSLIKPELKDWGVEEAPFAIVGE